MPHDRNGNLLVAGDIVNVPFKVKVVHSGEDFCNVDLESLYTMPGNNSTTNLSAINTKQTEKR